MLISTVAPPHPPSPLRGEAGLRTVEPAQARVAGPSNLRAEVVTSYETFVGVETEWNDAVDRARVPHPFLRHEWMRTWWDNFRGSASLEILLLRADGRIAAIAPFMREQVRMYGLPVTRLRLLQNDHTPRVDFIIAERPDESYEAIWQWLRHDAASWDVLQLSQLQRSSRTMATVKRFAQAEGLSTGVWQSSDSPYLELTRSWEQYLGSLPAKFRSNLRNRLSRLTKIGEPTFEVLRDRASIEGGYADALRLEASGWKQQAGTSICSDPAVQRFYTMLTERASKRGWLELLFLKVGDRRIATSYGSTYDGRLFLFKTGYDPEYATCSPFKLLTYFAVQHAYANGLRELDFLGDSEPWKREWTTTARSHDWLFVFADNCRARLLHQLKFKWLPELKRWRA
jgi:CelD/BcsL family acetyltransferase involved in cellulose biosynthesis